MDTLSIIAIVLASLSLAMHAVSYARRLKQDAWAEANIGRLHDYFSALSSDVAKLMVRKNERP